MAQPAGRRPEDDASTRERILDVALASFAELGFDGTSTRAIAAGAGVNQGLIPYYFGTKEALWQEAVGRAFARLRDGLGDVAGVRDSLPTDDPAAARARLALLIRRYVRFVADNPEFVRLMEEEGKREGRRMHWLVDHHVRPLFEGLTDLIGASGLAPAGQLHPVLWNYIFVGAVGTLFHQAPECRRLSGIDPMDPAVVDTFAETVVQLFLGPDV